MSKITKLVLGSQVEQKEQPTNEYELVVSFMHGDADHYSKEVYTYPLAEEDELLKAINFFNACMAAYPHGRGGNDTYAKLGLPDWEEWEDSIPYDITHDQNEATVDGIKVYFWTDDSQQYEVVLK